MALSGSYDYSLTAQNIIEEAYFAINVVGDGQSVSASRLQKGIRLLNNLMKQYPGLIQKIWGISRVVQALQSPTIWVDDADATKYWEAILPHTTAASNRPTSGDDYIAYYKSTSTAGSSWSTAQSAVSKSVYTLDTSIVTVKNVQLIKESTRDVYDLKKLSRDDFKSASLDKTLEGDVTHFYFERLATGSSSYLHLYPAPSSTASVLVMDTVRYPQDIDLQTNNVDFPQEWYRVLIFALALDLALGYPAVSPAKKAELQAYLRDALSKAEVLDEESGSVYFS